MSNPTFDSIRRHCQGLPETLEERKCGRVIWRVKGKPFAIAMVGGRSVTVKADMDQPAAHPVRTADPLADFGWVTVQVAEDPNLGTAMALIDASYEAAASHS